MADGERVLIALGGNAMTGPDGAATPEAQRAAVSAAMEHVAALAAAGHEVALTHGNGPQVGNLLIKNQLARDVVPPVPLDWCGAQTQATVGMLVLNALDAALARHGVDRRPAVVVTRTRVDPADPAFAVPVKPVGRHLPMAEARAYQELGQTWRPYGDRGWRRVVASPEPLEILDAAAVRALMAAGAIVVAAGGGGIPVARTPDGTLVGVEAVVDKDLGAALLARAVGATSLVIATDVPCAVVGHGTHRARPIGAVTPDELRRLAAGGYFAAGSMGPKVEAALRFVEAGGRRAAITSLDRITDAARGAAGTVVAYASPTGSSRRLEMTRARPH